MLAGKITLVVRIGPNRTLALYLGVGVVACLAGVVFALNGRWMALLLPLLYLTMHVMTYLRMKQIWEGRALNGILGETARNIFIYGLLTSIGILISSYF